MSDKIEIRLNVSTLILANPDNEKHRYIVRKTKMDHIEFNKKYNVGDVECKQATPVNIDSEEQKFFLFCVTDCYDPQIAIVCADKMEEAYEWFVDELDWSHISEPDLKDYDEESLSYNSNGTPYDSEQIHGFEVKLIGVEV